MLFFKYLSILIIFLLSMLSSEAQEKNILKFPESYFGKYIGTLKMNSKKGTQEYAMEFHLLPTDSVGKYRYTLVYGEGEQRQERLYTLYTQDAENGEYVVDENNGIVLDDKVIDNRMYALFEVQGTLLTTFITFETDHLLFEIAVAKREDKNISGGQDRDTPQVISYPITTVQRAVLIKQ